MLNGIHVARVGRRAWLPSSLDRFLQGEGDGAMERRSNDNAAVITNSRALRIIIIMEHVYVEVAIDHGFESLHMLPTAFSGWYTTASFNCERTNLHII